VTEAAVEPRATEKAAGEVDGTGHEAPAATSAGAKHQFITSGQLPAPAMGGGSATPPTASERAYGNADPAAVVKPAALRAVSRVIEERQSSPAAHAGVAEQGGHALGVALGVIVTEALAAIPSWNAPVLDDHGAQVEEVPGATRIGDHPILKRHEEVVGPKITAAVENMSPGVLHDLLTGVGVGATEAPGDSYRLEVHIADLIRRHLGK
jgi:hypothetical protein